MERRCVWCGDKDNLTRDHVVSRLHLRLLLQEQYARFCADVRKINLQPMCGFCNNEKSDKSVDLRPVERQIDLRNKLREYGIDHLVEWSLLTEYDGQDVETGIVRFTASWCVPCRQYKPIFDSVAARFDLPFYVIDIEQYPAAAEAQGVRSIPAVFKVQDGVWTKFVQPPGAAELRDAVLDLTG